jgi:predicted transposase/invertase (TIGR01784 family)
MKFVNPKNDVAFKKIFGSEEKKEILISFLNAVLDLTGDRAIEEVQILNPYQAPKLELLKETLLDVQAKDKRGVTFIVEMQVEYTLGLKKRFLYYAAKSYVSQIGRGQEYPRLNQVVFIGILDFNAFEGEDYLSRHLILNQKTHRQEIEDLELNFIELPKFTKKADEVETILEKWIYFIQNAGDLKVVPPNADLPPLRAAYEVANQFGWSQEDMEIYEYRGIKIQDEQGALELAHKKGRLESLYQILTVRFGGLPAELERRLEPLGLPALEELTTAALTLPTLPEFAQRVDELERYFYAGQRYLSHQR